MNFDLTEEQKLLKQTIRDFAETQIAPGAAARDEAARFPTELIPKMAEVGLFGIMIPQEYGGGGFDNVRAALLRRGASPLPCPRAAFLPPPNFLPSPAP